MFVVVSVKSVFGLLRHLLHVTSILEVFYIKTCFVGVCMHDVDDSDCLQSGVLIL